MVHKLDKICLSETHRDSSVMIKTETIETWKSQIITILPTISAEEYAYTTIIFAFARSRHSVCVCECQCFEPKIGDTFCNFVVLYRSPSQSPDKFEKFMDNF